MKWSNRCNKCRKEATVVAKEELILKPKPPYASREVQHFESLCIDCLKPHQVVVEMIQEA